MINEPAKHCSTVNTETLSKEILEGKQTLIEAQKLVAFLLAGNKKQWCFLIETIIQNSKFKIQNREFKSLVSLLKNQIKTLNCHKKFFFAYDSRKAISCDPNLFSNGNIGWVMPQKIFVK